MPTSSANWVTSKHGGTAVSRRDASIAVIMAMQAVSQRLFWIIPDWPSDAPHAVPFFTVIGNAGQHLDLWASYGRTWVVAIGLIEYVVLAALSLLWLYRYSAIKGPTLNNPAGNGRSAERPREPFASIRT